MVSSKECVAAASEHLVEVVSKHIVNISYLSSQEVDIERVRVKERGR